MSTEHDETDEEVHGRPRPERAAERIKTDARILGGKPVIRGTRIPVELVLRKLGEGASEEDLLAAYPGLRREDVRAALAYGAERIGR